MTDNSHYDLIKIPRILYSLSYRNVTANIPYNNMINQNLLSLFIQRRSLCINIRRNILQNVLNGEVSYAFIVQVELPNPHE